MKVLSKKAAVIFILLGTIHFSIGRAHSQEPERATSLNFELNPLLQYWSLNGDKRNFAEDHWIREGWSGGLDHFLLKKPLKDDWLIHMEGRAVVPEKDYLFNLEIKKKDLGFFRMGYGEYQKYFDDSGGFFRPFSSPVFDLNNDLRLGIGNYFLEAGMTRPGLPQVIVGYEQKFKEGKKSLLEWGSVSEDGLTRNLFPSYKEMDEKLDIIKVEVAHDIGRVHLGDRFRYEWYKTFTTRFEKERDLDTGTSETVNVSEKYNHKALFNTFHLESQIKKKLYFSLGYLLNNLKGDAAFSMLTDPFGPEPFDKNWRTRSINLDQESHVLNLNTRIGPYRQLSFHGGIQAEITETAGDADALFTETLPGLGPVSPEAQIRSSTDKKGLMETAGVRYSGIPYTSLYAEGKWTQQGIDLFEREVEEADLTFERFTKTEANRNKYTLGFSSSPIRRLTFSGLYRRSDRENVYDHQLDSEPGYSAFIKKQELNTEEIAAKVTARLTTAIKGTLQYQLLKTAIDTWTQTIPPSSVQSGDYLANLYSVGITAAPASTLYLTALFSYRDVTSKSFNNESAPVIGYDGDVYSFLGTAQWAAGKKTDFTLEYSFSWSDNFHNNSADGLPLGVDHKRIGLSLGCSRKITDQIQARFLYGYYKYNEENNGGRNDYDAHLFRVALAFKF